MQLFRKFILILIKLLIIFSSYYSIYCGDDNVNKILIGIHLIVIGILSILLVREVKKKICQETETPPKINTEDKSLPDEVIEEIIQSQDLWVDIFIFNYWV